MSGAANFILVEGIGNGSGRLFNAIEDAVIRCCGIAKPYNLFSAEKLLLHIEYNSEKTAFSRRISGGEYFYGHV